MKTADAKNPIDEYLTNAGQSAERQAMHHAGSENPEAWKPNAGDFKCSGVNLDGPLMKILDLAFLKDEFF